MLLSFLSQFMSFLWVIACSYILRRFACEYILNWKDFVKQLEWLFGNFFVMVCDFMSVKCFNMLESVYNEWLQRNGLEDFIVVHENTIQSVQTLNFTQQNEWVQVVVTQYQPLQFGKLFELVKNRIVYNEIKPDIVKMNFLYLIVELRALQNFKCIAIDVEYFVCFNLCMTTLNKWF